MAPKRLTHTQENTAVRYQYMLLMNTRAASDSLYQRLLSLISKPRLVSQQRGICAFHIQTLFMYTGRISSCVIDVCVRASILPALCGTPGC